MFNNSADVVGVLRRVCRNSASGHDQASAGKLDQAATWKHWVCQLRLKFKNMTGPGSPHYFKFVRRCDLGLPLMKEHGHLGSSELAYEITDFPHNQHKDPKDVMLVVKSFMADRRPLQVVAIAPVSYQERILSGLR